MTSPLDLTVIIPCKNEAENIAACIASARLLADEVLVADSGSSDGTLELAKINADRVIEREYVDSGDFKNWAIPQAKCGWIFVLDADERVTPELATEIRDTLQQRNRTDSTANPLAYSVPRRNFFLGHAIDHGDWASDRVTRLFTRDDCRYKLHTDHSEIDVSADRLGKLKQKLTHYTAWDLDPYLLKMHHYARQQAKLWQDQGRKPALSHLILNAPMRFLRGYVLKMGWRDGLLGFFIAGLTGYYSFMKQFYFWQLTHARHLADFEPAGEISAPQDVHQAADRAA